MMEGDHLGVGTREHIPICVDITDLVGHLCSPWKEAGFTPRSARVLRVAPDGSPIRSAGHWPRSSRALGRGHSAKTTAHKRR